MGDKKLGPKALLDAIVIIISPPTSSFFFLLLLLEDSLTYVRGTYIQYFNSGNSISNFKIVRFYALLISSWFYFLPLPPRSCKSDSRVVCPL